MTTDQSRHAEAGLLSWPVLTDRLRGGAAAVLCIGSFEQHGPHLPMATDTIIVEHLAEEVARHLNGLRLPTLAYGAPSRPRSGGGDVFTAPSLTLEGLLGAVRAIASGAIDAGARSLVVLSWHMENAAVLWDALRPALHGSSARALLFEAPWDYLPEEIVGELFPEGPALWPSDHAGRLETSVMLHLAPALVGDAPAPVPFRPRARYDVLPTPVDAVPETGVVLDCGLASAEQGQRCWETMVAGIVQDAAAELALGMPG